MLYDAVATQDTVMMVSCQIRRCRRLIGEAAGLELSWDYDSGARPGCDWSDREERARLIDDLVSDALAVLAVVGGLDLTTHRPTRRGCWRWWRAKTSRPIRMWRAAGA